MLYNNLPTIVSKQMRNRGSNSSLSSALVTYSQMTCRASLYLVEAYKIAKFASPNSDKSCHT